MGWVIPSINTGTPTEEYGNNDLPARLGNEPENESVKEPALRHTRRDQQQNRISITIAKQSQQNDRAGKDQNRDKMLVFADLAEPQYGPSRDRDETRDRHTDTCPKAGDAEPAKKDRKANLGF